MGRTRKRFSKEFRAEVAFEALKGEKTMTELSSEFSVHATHIAKWKKELADAIPGIFAGKGDPEEKSKDKLIEDLHKRIGQIEMENNWLKKTAVLSIDDRKKLLDRTDKSMSFRKQCELLDISRAGLYYEPKGESDYNIELMNMIDKEYTDHPDMGVPSMTAYLRNSGKKCGPKRVRRLMRLMGLEAIYPKPRTSIPNKQHEVYPYLLKDVELTRPNQVWSTDITYIRLKHGFAYLVAIMDWHSRKVLSWRLSNTMDVGFCCEALEEAFLFYGKPDVFNSDQGPQFTSGEFIGLLKGKGIEISMTGKGRALDNVFIERLWRTVKYGNVYIKGYETIAEATVGLKEYFEYYNERRGHSSLGHKCPDVIYYGESYQHIHSINKEKKRSKKREMTATATSNF